QLGDHRLATTPSRETGGRRQFPTAAASVAGPKLCPLPERTSFAILPGKGRGLYSRHQDREDSTMRVWTRLAAAALCVTASTAAQAELLPGTAELTGTVTVPKDKPIVRVYAYNAAKKMGYAVFAVDGKYRAVDLLPGTY